MLLIITSVICALLVLLGWYMIQDDPEILNYGRTVIKPAYPKLFYLKLARKFLNLTKHLSMDCGFHLIIAALTEFSRGYKTLRFDMANKKILFLLEPNALEVVLNSSTHIEKSVFYRFLHPWLGFGLLTSSGEKWRHRRKLLTPAFHFTILEEFLPIFNNQSSILVSKIQNLSAEKPFVDISPLMLACTLDVISETAMGVTINAQGSESDYFNAIGVVTRSFFYRVVRPWLHPDFLYKLSPSGRRFYRNLQIIKDYNWKVIQEKKAELLSKGQRGDSVVEPDGYKKKRKAFLELLLEYHFQDPSLTEEDIAHEVHTFMFEGHDTTAMGITWAIYFLGLDQTVQQKVIDELDDIFGDDVDREVTREDLSRMKYLECVIKETLRLHPSVPFFAREVQEPFKMDDFTVEKGTTILIYVWSIHRDKAYFENPEKFIPERFFPENSIGRHPYAYIPFSAGPRNCIGQKFAFMEEKTVLSHIFRRFRAHSLDQRDKLTIETPLLTKCTNPVRVKFTPRSRDI